MLLCVHVGGGRTDVTSEAGINCVLLWEVD